MSAPVFGDDSAPSTPAGTTTDDILARFTGQDDAPSTPPPTAQTTPAATQEVTPEATTPSTASFLESYKDDPEFQTDLAAIQQKYGNDREALRGLLNATKLVGQRNDLAQLGKALVETPDRAMQWLAQNHPQLLQQFVQPPPEPEPAPKNGHPSPNLFQLLKYVDKEKLDSAPEAFRDGLRNMLQEATLQESPSYKKVTEELNTLKQQLAQVAQPPVDPRDYVNAALAQVESRRSALDFINSNREWLFANKQSGPLAPDGILFNAELQRATQRGAPSDVAIELAMAKVNQNKAPSTKPAQTPNKKVTENKPSTSKVAPEAADIPWDESLGVAGNAKNLAKALGLNLRDMELSF